MVSYSELGLSAWGFWLNLATAAFIILGHKFFDRPKSAKSIWVMGAMVLLWFGWSFALGFFSEITARDEFAGLLSYSIFLFVLMSDVLRCGLARYLTERRGEKWTKEIDYIYLALGAVGLVVSIGKVTHAVDRISPASTLGLLAIATALVLRAIKTRAEIANWNRQV